MNTKFVVSIDGAVLYFDDRYQPSAPFQPIVGEDKPKPTVALVPLREVLATAKEWDAALAGYSTTQRAAAQISVVQDAQEL